MAKCKSCHAGKAKKACPALNIDICDKCCRTKMEQEIACPGDCVFLIKSKQSIITKEQTLKMRNFEKEMKSIIRNEEEHLDILQNIEFIVYTHHKENVTISDRDVEAALEYLMERGKNDLGLDSKNITDLSNEAKILIESIDGIFLLRDKFDDNENLILRLKCINRVLKSVKDHFNSKNEYNYLNFIGSFVGYTKFNK